MSTPPQTPSIASADVASSPLPVAQGSSVSALQPNEDCKQLEPIAVVGMACRLPGKVSSADDLWQMCAQGTSGWSEIPKTRFNHESFYHPDPDNHGTSHTIGGHFLQDDISLFDAPFFRITAAEAKAMDPQQRIMLETAYESLENAAIPLHAIAGKNVGVFAGMSISEYGIQLKRDTDTLPMFAATGCADALMSNRLSYFFDFRGPSMTVDTACSSTLTAMHLACQSLRSKDSSMAVVGGCRLLITPDEFIAFTKSRLLSPQGKSYAFDHRATSGYGRGEGAGCVVLKTLKDALRDGDNIRGLIRNSGINQDGTTPGITMPSSDAQEALIRSVYNEIRIDPSEIGYIESHGTGTAVGDPIEAAALGAVFGSRSAKSKPIYVGSVKSNVGHLEGASGVVSIIKTILMLERGFILPNCDFEKLNPNIPFSEWNMKVPSRVVPWPRSNIRRASVDNFGFGGSNAHFVLEEKPRIRRELVKYVMLPGSSMADEAVAEMIKPQLQLGKTRRLIVLSAKDEWSARAQAADLAQHMKDRPEALYRSHLSSLALTLQRRSLFPWRIALSVKAQNEIHTALGMTNVVPVRGAIEPRIGFIFTGQGAQWYGMGRELMCTYPVFTSVLLTAQSILTRMGAQWSLVDELSKDADSSLINNAYISQPACTAVQIALVELLSSWGIRPGGVVGHSSGEIAAAYAAGALAIDTAMSIAYHRGASTIMFRRQFPRLRGAMLAIGGSETELNDFLERNLNQNVIKACVNSPTSLTLSGDEEAIAEVDRAAKIQKIFSRKLHTDVAYHSHHMGLVAESYRSSLGDIKPRSISGIAFHSSLTGCLVETSKLDTTYWVNNLTSPVLFSQALESFCTSTDGIPLNEQKTVLIEVGPHSALKGPTRQILMAIRAPGLKQDYLPTLIRGRDAVETTLETAAILFVKGCNLKLPAINFPTEDPRMPEILTDLPSYPWKHRESYWHESRIAKTYRLRSGVRNDILGALTTDSNDLEPKWRNIIRTEEMPWLRHHKVQGNIVYPMSGYLVMVIEAMRRRATSRGTRFREYSFREVSLSRALIVPESTDVEITTNLRPYNQSTKTSSEKWDEFRIFSWMPDRGWNEHCRGMIAVSNDLDSNLADDVFSSSIPRNQPWQQREPSDPQARDQSPVDSQRLYEVVEKANLHYGELFRGLSDLKVGRDWAVGTVQIPDTAALTPHQFQTELVIHPVTLDLCAQIILPTLIPSFSDFYETYMPSFISSMTISDDINKTVGGILSLRVQRKYSSNSKKQATASISVVDPKLSGNAFAIEIQGLTVTRISDTAVQSWNPGLSFSIEWKAHAHHLKPLACQSMLCLEPISASEKQKIQIHELVSCIFLDEALKQISPEQQSSMNDHHKRFYRWIGNLLEQKKATSVLSNKRWAPAESIERQEIIEQARQSGTAGTLICEVGEKLDQILLGATDALSIMLDNELLGKYYRDEDFFARSYTQAAAYVDLLAHQNPHLKILEIGAGTGGATLPVLQVLGGGSQKPPRFLRYEFTDISSGLFDKAKSSFKSWEGLVEYRILDVEKKPLDQGFNSEDYDLIIAANVLHATRSLNKTMENVRTLLKPGGKLIILEETVNALRRFPFALLPGTLLSTEEARQDSPLISESEWNVVLKATGFSGLDVSLQDYPGEEVHTGSLMLSTALNPTEVNIPDKVIIICSKELTRLALSHLRNELELATGSAPQVMSLVEAVNTNLNETIYIFLDELESPFLTNMDPERFAQVQALCQAKGLLWVVEGAYTQSASPNANMVLGLARAIRSENATVKFVSLDLDQRQRLPGNAAAEAVAEVYVEAFQSNSTQREMDLEFSERNGVLHVPRLVENSVLDSYVGGQTQESRPERQRIHQKDRPLTMRVRGHGTLDSFYFEDNGATTVSLGPHDVRIKIMAMGLNFKDVLVALGQIEDNLGGECSGIVADVGSEVTGLKIGDRVCALPRNSYSTSEVCNSSVVIGIPNEMSFATAASIPVIYCTAYHSLVNVARLCHGESILIHAAAGGVGQAAIMLAQMLGAEVFATVGSKRKKEFLKETYGLTDDHIFSSRNSAFGKHIRNATRDKGVDVVLNSLGGDYLMTGWYCLATFGRFIEIGKRDIRANMRLEMAQFRNCATFASVDLVLMIQEKPELVQSLLSDVMDLLRKGSVRPASPITTFSIQDVEKGFRALQSGSIIGKVVFEHRLDDEVMVMPSTLLRSTFPPDATYVLTGGAGGLGRSMARWLVQQGAKNIVLASRRGRASQQVCELIAELETDTVKIVGYQCDVGKQDQVEKMINDITATMPPIRGVVHGAMVLHDMLFEQLSHDDYVSVVTPKVQGAWNLHECLPKSGLDFFVLLSSVAGVIGSRGQAMYAGTSTFLGAFAHWRRAQDLPATVIHLGAVSEVGYIAESTERQEIIAATYGEKGMSEKEFLAYLKAAIDGQLSKFSDHECVTSLKLEANLPEPYWAADAKFSHCRRAIIDGHRQESVDTPSITTSHLLKQARSMESATQVVYDSVAAKFSSILMIPAEDIVPSKPVVAYGLDSLVSVEIRNWIARELDAKMQLLEVLNSSSLQALAATIVRNSGFVNQKIFEMDAKEV